jgi:hypothetical protein
VTAPAKILQVLTPVVDGLPGKRFGFHWVEVNVPSQRQQIPITLHQFGFVASSIQMPGAIMLGVEPDRIGRIELVHERTQVCSGGFNQQMKMVGHEGVGIEPDMMSGNVFIQYIEKSLAVAVLMKNLLPPGAAGRYVIDGAFELYAEYSSHG